jgi:spore coat protein U-like protein
MHNIKSYKNILALIFCLIPLYASSQSTTEANLEVKATVQAACQISTKPLYFGNYDPLSLADLHAQGGVIMKCVAKAAPKIYLDSGKNPKAAFAVNNF